MEQQTTHESLQQRWMTGSEPQLCRLGFPNDEYIYVGKYGEGIREEKRRETRDDWNQRKRKNQGRKQAKEEERGSIKALLRLYQGSIKALLRTWRGRAKALCAASLDRCDTPWIQTSLEAGVGWRNSCRPASAFCMHLNFKWCWRGTRPRMPTRTKTNVEYSHILVHSSTKSNTTSSWFTALKQMLGLLCVNKLGIVLTQSLLENVIEQ